MLVLVQAILDLADGGVDRELAMNAPEVQGVAASMTLETTKDVPLHID